MGRSYMTIGSEIAAARKAAGLSQEEFADSLNVARTTVSSWETNKAVPNPKIIKALIRRRHLDIHTVKELLIAAKNGIPLGKFLYSIVITPPTRLINAGCHFGLNVGRLGPNDENLMGHQPLNYVIFFKTVGSRGALKATVGTNRNLGFQFKCFVDFKNLDFMTVSIELNSRGFIVDTTPGGGCVSRLWFLLPDEAIVTTPEGIRDNFFYPE